MSHAQFAVGNGGTYWDQIAEFERRKGALVVNGRRRTRAEGWTPPAEVPGPDRIPVEEVRKLSPPRQIA